MFYNVFRKCEVLLSTENENLHKAQTVHGFKCLATSTAMAYLMLKASITFATNSNNKKAKQQ